ncbi:MAG: glycosyltransferase [Microbacteriaceae bacterium]|nr:glycosyltransferase [Microbacteriaceae bacterium]
MRGLVRRLDDGGAATLQEPGVVVILRYSVWSRVVEAAAAASGRLVLWYHNITPGDLLRPWNESLAHDCDRARAALPGIARRARLLVADSEFNAAELEQGGRGAVIVPLLLDVPRAPLPARPAQEPPVVLSVGRIAPSKRVDDTIKAFTLFQRHRAPDARLVLVGSEDGFRDYRIALDRLVDSLGTRGIVFTGRISDEDRNGWYRRADAYLCMSAHEGFCAPLVEAMARGVPVVARDAGAVRETIGRAGLVVDGDLPLVSEALHEVIESPGTRQALSAAAVDRVRELDPDVVAIRLIQALAPVLPA